MCPDRARGYWREATSGWLGERAHTRIRMVHTDKCTVIKHNLLSKQENNLSGLKSISEDVTVSPHIADIYNSGL